MDFEASIEEAYERGVEAGRADVVPPGVVPLPWCEVHNREWISTVSVHGCLYGYKTAQLNKCRREAKVAHWVTVKEGTTT